ncbi:MAG: HPP family protein [Halobacteriaceae archaeon]
MAGRLRTLLRRARRVERRELHEFRAWLETTSNLTRVSVVLFVPLLIGLVTVLSRSLTQLSFLLFPPLASGTYTLFADPEGRYSSPRRFVGGLTTGALCGWAAIETSARFLYHVQPSALGVHAGAAALSVFLTAVVTWALSVELPTAFSTALLVLFAGTSQFAYVVSVALASLLVAGVFLVWREEFYDRRAKYLYGTTQSDDHVLVPMRGDRASTAAMFGARIAAAHDAAKVVLLDVVGDEDVAQAERAALSDGEGTAGEGVSAAVDEAASRLEAEAHRIETKVGVPCEVLVTADDGDAAATTLHATREANCDLVVAPFEGPTSEDAGFVRRLFQGDVDVVGFRPQSERTRWRHSLVPVRRASDGAHAMIDYAERLAGPTGGVSVCTCIDSERERRRAETMLANLVEPVDVGCETRVSRSSIESFLDRNAQNYDVVFLGASTDRTAASRLLSRPTYERIGGIEADVAVVHRA